MAAFELRYWKRQVVILMGVGSAVGSIWLLGEPRDFILLEESNGVDRRTYVTIEICLLIPRETCAIAKWLDRYKIVKYWISSGLLVLKNCSANVGMNL